MLSMRFELIISSLQDWCLTTMALKALLEPGIEPGHLDWKSSSLPLTYSSIFHPHLYIKIFYI